MKHKFYTSVKSLALLCSLFFLCLNFAPMQVHAHNAYFANVVLDEGSFQYVPTVIYDENSWTKWGHRESDIADFGSKTINKDWSVPVVDYSQSDISKSYDSQVGGGGTNKPLVFSFPPVHGGTTNYSVQLNATGEDEQLAQRYANYVVGGLNEALNFMTSHSGNKLTIQSFKKLSAELANKAPGKSGEITVPGGKTFKLSAGNPQKTMTGLEKSDYVRISTSDGAFSIDVPYRTPKGYAGSRATRTGMSQGFISVVNGQDDGLFGYAARDAEYLDWRYTVLQANYNADVKGFTYSNLAEVTKPGVFESAISSMLSGVVSGLNSFLGLHNLPDLMMNEGARDASYFKGVMPYSWMQSAHVLHMICQIIAWSLLGFAFVRMLLKRQLRTMNIGERISLMEGFKNIIMTAFMLGGFVLVFGVLLDLNYALVDIFTAQSANSLHFGTTHSMGGSTLSTVLINIAYFILGLYYNFLYVLRGITIALLYGIAPLAIFTFSLGGRYTEIFGKFTKELIVNIFIQSFHAICIGFFMNALSGGTLKTFEVLVVFMAFIPLTNFIRSNILGLSNGIMDQANGMKTAAVSMGSGIAGAVVGSKLAGAKGASGGKQMAGASAVNSKAQQAMTNPAPKTSTGRGGVANEQLMADSRGNIHTGGVSESLMHSSDTGLTGKAKQFGSDMGAGFGPSMQMAGNLAMAGLNAGVVLGGAATDDKALVNSHSRAISGNMSNSIAQGRTAVQARNASSAMRKEAQQFGVHDMYDNGERLTMQYAASKGADGSVEFSDPAFNETVSASNVNEMVTAFTGTGDYAPGGLKSGYQDAAIRHYQQKGVQSAGWYQGKPIVTAEKGKVADMGQVARVAPYQPTQKDIASRLEPEMGRNPSR